MATYTFEELYEEEEWQSGLNEENHHPTLYNVFAMVDFEIDERFEIWQLEIVDLLIPIRISIKKKM